MNLAVKIRLKRMGAKKRPAYRIVVSDSRNPRDGKSIEEIGFYDPTTSPSTFKVEEDRAVLWLERGAIPTRTVRSILGKAGVIDRWQAGKAEE